MKTSIYSLMIAVTCSVTGMASASANTILSADKYKGMHMFNDRNNLEEHPLLKGEPTFKGSENFVKAFPNALVESCETKDNFTKVKFSWNGDALEAFYDTEGTLIATSHFIDPKNLPLSVQMQIKESYQDYLVFQAVEFYHTEKGLSYYVIVKKKDKALVLQAATNGTISILKRLKN